MIQPSEHHKVRRQHIKCTIVPYIPAFKARYKTLNSEWLTKYFEIEDIDERLLADPEQEILKKGGYIFFACVDGEAVGTCTLLQHGQGSFELSKMCVTEAFQGMGIGEQLVDEAIAKACEMDAARLVLFTNEKLQAAVALYKKKGFKIINPSMMLVSGYKRESLCMCLDLPGKTVNV